MSALHTPEELGLNTLFLDLNSYFASVEQNENPDLRGKPVAVVPMMTDATCAIAASYEAKAYGVKTGTKIYDAKRMCPHLRLVLARHDVYTRYHLKVLEATNKHIPVTKKWSIDEFHCDLMGREKIPENARALAMRIKWMKEGAPKLEPITAPTRIFWGEGDRIAKIEWADKLGDYFSNLKFSPAPNAGHFVHYEQPEMSNREMLAFFTPLAANGGWT